MEGRLLTDISRPARFCQMLLGYALGPASLARPPGALCRRKPARGSKILHLRHLVCSTSVRRSFEIDLPRSGLFLTGQFYCQAPNPREEAERIRRLAAAHALDGRPTDRRPRASCR
jgi:hypothetical protein